MPRNYCIFGVLTKKYKSPMPNNKSTNVFSENGKFFKEKDATSAMNAIMGMMDALSLSEKRLFGIESRRNCKLTQLQLLGLLMLFPCFMIRNAYICLACTHARATHSTGFFPRIPMTGARSSPQFSGNFGVKCRKTAPVGRQAQSV